jgi:hypothetical protein
LQKCVTLSSTEAELNALSDAAQQALYLCNNFTLFSINNNMPMPIYNNNQSALTRDKYLIL